MSWASLAQTISAPLAANPIEPIPSVALGAHIKIVGALNTAKTGAGSTDSVHSTVIQPVPAVACPAIISISAGFTIVAAGYAHSPDCCYFN